MEKRRWASMRFRIMPNEVTAASAVAFSILPRVTNSGVRSTSVATEDTLRALLISAFPVPWQGSRSSISAGRLWMLTLFGMLPRRVFAPRPGPPALAGLSQTGDQFRSQLAARQGVQRGVDGFVTGQQGRLIGDHVSQ
ncbi:MAG: hypothetical protein VB142_08665, partial [Burkholderia sp.]